MGTFAALVVRLVSALHVIGSGYGGPRSILNLARGVKAMAINFRPSSHTFERSRPSLEPDLSTGL